MDSRRSVACTFLLAVFTAVLGAEPGGAQLLTIENPTPGDSRIRGVGIVGDALLVHEFVASTDVRNLHQYDASTGAYVRLLAAGDASSVAARGDDILVGFLQEGVARLYDADTGAVLQTFLPPAGQEEFGTDVGVAGTDVLVSSPLDAAVYRFDVATGAVLQTYADPTPNTEGVRGFTLATVGSLLVVGDPGDDVAAANGGAVHVFDLASGALVRSIPNPAPTAGYQMGRSLVVKDGVIWAGASEPADAAHFPAGKDIGVVHRFDLATGTLLQTIRNPSPKGGRTTGTLGPDAFGFAVRDLGGVVGIAALRQVNFNAGERGVVLYGFDAAGNLVETVRAGGVVPGFDPDAEYWLGIGTTSGARFVTTRAAEMPAQSSVWSVDVVGPCGNGVLDAGEQCDDGNLLAGDCCTETCQLTVPPTCTAGFPGASSLSLKRTAGQTKDTLSFTWVGGAPVQAADLGTPLAGTDYALCVIQDVAGTPTLRLSATLPATDPCPQLDACWKTSAGALKYKASVPDPDGIKQASVRAGSVPRATVKGQGPLLGSRPMPVAGPLTVRLQRRDAPVCFEATFGNTVQVNTAAQYRARGD